MDSSQPQAGPSRRIKPSVPFVSAQHRPVQSDGKFRVVIVSTGSVASIKMPDIVGALSRIPEIEMQIVATKASLHFYDQARIDEALRKARSVGDTSMTMDGQSPHSDDGVRIWRDEDEWSDWKQIGDPILHIELRRWADLVIIAPCSADFLAKLAAGFSDNLALIYWLSMMRALTPETPVILCPAMNTHMYQHPFTADHLKTVQEKLHYMISGPQGSGALACGDEGVGKMTEWREIVSIIENFGAMYIQRHPKLVTSSWNQNPSSTTQSTNPAQPQFQLPPTTHSTSPRPPTPPTPNRSLSGSIDRVNVEPNGNLGPKIKSFAEEDWNSLTNAYGGDGKMWEKRWWIS